MSNEKEKPEVSGQRRILRDAIQSIHENADITAIMALRHGASPLKEDDDFDPLYDALYGMNAKMAGLIIAAIIRRSQVYDGDVLNEAKTEEALARNLLNRTEHDHKLGRSPLELAASNDAEGILKTVWGHFKDKVDINKLYGSGSRLTHWAATYPDNLEYLLAEGARIDEPDIAGQTPLMRMFDGAYAISFSTTVDELLEIFKAHKANTRAVDNEGHGLPYYALSTIVRGDIKFPQMRCIDKALTEGLDFLAADAKGKTPVDHFMEHSDLTPQAFADVFDRLATHGYIVAPLMQKYAGKLVLQKGSLLVEQYKETVCRQLEEPDLPAKLWNPDDTPSTLLLSAFGYAVPDKIFAHPSLRNNPTAAKALYEKMEAKLPPQCKELLHNGIDIAYFRDAAKPGVPSAIAKALRRKDSPPAGQAPDNGVRGKG